MRGKVTLDGQEYEINEVLGTRSRDGGRYVELDLVKVIGPNDRELYWLPVSESITEFNVGSMEKGAPDTVVNWSDSDDHQFLLNEIGSMEPGTALVIIRRKA